METGTLRCSLLISEMSFFRPPLVFMLETEEFILKQISHYSDEPTLWCFSCCCQMFSGFGCFVFILINPKQRLPAVKSLIQSVIQRRRLIRHLTTFCFWYWLRYKIWMLWLLVLVSGKTRTSWKSLLWSFTCSTESASPTGSFSYPQDRKQQDVASRSFVSNSQLFLEPRRLHWFHFIMLIMLTS